MSNQWGSNSGLFGIPPGGPYFVGPTGTIQRQDNRILAQGLASTGWIGFPTMALAENYAHNGGIASKVNSTVGGVTDFLGRLTDPNTWIRVAEITLGVILVAIGLAKMTNAIPVATKIAKRIGTTAEVAAVA